MTEMGGGLIPPPILFVTRTELVGRPARLGEQLTQQAQNKQGRRQQSYGCSQAELSNM